MSVVLGFVASVVNLPALSVPAGLTDSGLPAGLQVSARVTAWTSSWRRPPATRPTARGRAAALPLLPQGT
jgi:hypothetical protein